MEAPSGASYFTWLHLRMNLEVSSPHVHVVFYHPSSENEGKKIIFHDVTAYNMLWLIPNVWGSGMDSISSYQPLFWRLLSLVDLLQKTGSRNKTRNLNLKSMNYYLCVPACTFNVKPVYVGPLTRCNAEVLPILLGDIALQTHAVQRPLVSMVWGHKDVLCSIKCYPIPVSTINAVGRYLRAVVCMMAVRKDCGLKKPANHTVEGNRKSDDQVSSSLILASRSMNHKVRPDMDG